jgi:glycosyltransferase involved in cell wall biosynthesis
VKGRPIRVMFVVPDLRVGGAERHVTTLLPRMDPARFTPSVVCIGDEGALFAGLPEAGIEALALNLKKRHALRALRELTAIMRNTDPDVVVLRGHNAETLGRIAARIAGVTRTIVWVHNIGDATPRDRIRVMADRALTRWTSAYFGVAEAQRQYLVHDLRYPEDKIRIIHNGVDPALFDAHTDRLVLREFGIADGDPVVGIVAALRPEKDHATLLRAARLVIEYMPRAKFLIIGDGPKRPELETLRDELEVTSNVCFTGARADVARLLAAIDVFTLSSATVECFPIALLEAMACGRPAVCTSVGGISEMLEDGHSGYLVPRKQPRKLADRLLTVLADPQAAQRMGRAARQRVESEFHLDLSVEAAQRAIEEVVAGELIPSGGS